MEINGKLGIEDGTSSLPGFYYRQDTNTGLYRPGADRLQVVTGGTAQWEFDASGHLVPVSDNAHDLGKSGTEIRDIYMDGTLVGAKSVETPTSFGSTSNVTATVTAPTNFTWAAVYIQRGQRVTAYIQMIAVASFTAGSGQYIFLLQGTVDSTNIPANMPIGAWQASVGGTLTGGNIRRQGTNSCRCTISAGGTFGSLQGMTNGDTLMLMADYLVT